MKRFFIGGIVIAMMTTCVIFNVKYNSQNDNQSDVSLLNIEALATCESAVRNERGSEATLECVNSAGERSTIKACDFDTRYLSQCSGRSR
jgi:hypothetical protein